MAVTSDFLVENLHCPSCVSAIENAVLSLKPKPASISVSILTHRVTVRHEPQLAVARIQEALEDAGFDVDCHSRPGPGHMLGLDGARNEYEYDTPRINWKRIQPAKKRSANEELERKRQHVAQCDICRKEEAVKTAKHSDKLSSTFTTTSSPAVTTTMTTSGKEHIGSTESLLGVTVGTSTSKNEWRASLAIGGMTCAACSGAISTELEQKSWVKKVVINLISNSGTVDFEGKENADAIVEAIEDIGYDATLDAVESLRSGAGGKTSSDIRQAARRKVEIQIQGMFCNYCPNRVVETLRNEPEFRIERPCTLESPILEISYVPSPPDLNIRCILKTISSIDPNFEVSIYHPPTLEERSVKIREHERRRLSYRIIVAFIIAIPTFLIGIVYMSLVPSSNASRRYLSQSLVAGVSRAQWSLFIMSTPAYFYSANVFHIRAIKEIRHSWRRNSSVPFLRRFYRFGSMNMLMSLGTSIAYWSSVAQLIAAGADAGYHPDDGDFYFDSVVFLTLFLLAGRWIEAYSKAKTGDAVTLLGKLRPNKAMLVISNEDEEKEKIEEVSVDELDFGDRVWVLHGASPPCDGKIVQGQSAFDESSLTGESMPVKKQEDDEVFAGTINNGGPVQVQITGVGGNSMLDQIVDAVREGQTKRAPIERLADKLTSVFVPCITYLAVFVWILWIILAESGALPDGYLGSGSPIVQALGFAIAVFVVACPCGLGLAAPTALYVGGGLATKYGILVKGGGEAFEKASKLDCIVFDKTGTLTMGGEPSVLHHTIFELPLLGPRQQWYLKEEQETEILGMIMGLEQQSSHPVAKAIVSFCAARGATPDGTSEVEEKAGRGMSGSIASAMFSGPFHLIIGNETMISDYGFTPDPSVSQALDSWKNDGMSVAVAAYHQTNSQGSAYRLLAAFAIADPIRPEAPSVIATLQKHDIATYMLSGDSVLTAQAIGRRVGIPAENVIAGVLPSEKASHIKRLQASLPSSRSTLKSTQRASVAMVGDGINDSVALTTADIGIAIGSGSDIAISSASFVLVSNNLLAILTLVELSRKVFVRIKMNFGWAMIYNIVAVPIAGGALYAVKSGGEHVRLAPVWASLAMAASSVSVVCSSLGLRVGVPGVGFRPRWAAEAEGVDSGRGGERKGKRFEIP